MNEVLCRRIYEKLGNNVLGLASKTTPGQDVDGNLLLRLQIEVTQSQDIAIQSSHLRQWQQDVKVT